MTWIETHPPSPEHPAVEAAMKRGLAGYPPEYSPDRRDEMRVPDAVRDDSIVRAHSLIPAALEHFFAGYAALLDPALPLTRRQHEMIATVVSAKNRCFY
jgi:hypothetical protein